MPELETKMMKGSDSPIKASEGESKSSVRNQKLPFRLVKDDTKPLLRDPILRSDPIETEQAVLRLPPFPFVGPKPDSR